MITVNNSVPYFSALTDSNKTVQLNDYLGKYIVLYFYPKDNTAGCTKQAQQWRDNYSRFIALNCIILGVSRDSIRSHANFKAKYELPFDLLADTDESLCQLFDVIKLKNMYGKQVRGIERSTFLINPQGLLIYEWRKVKVDGHIDAVIRVLESDAIKT